MTKITHIFFDIGSTLVDETECYNHRIRDMIAGTEITFERFREKQELIDFDEAAKFFGLTKTPWHSEDERLFPDTADVLRYLFDKGYTLGIIANQVAGSEQRLEGWGIRQYFNSVTASTEEGVFKPDLEIFRRAFDKADCSAENSVMIGDRLDNDIAPAKALGMMTVWVRRDYSVNNPIEQSDYTITNLTELKTIF